MNDSNKALEDKMGNGVILVKLYYIAMGLLLVAILPMPYFYYQLLRLIIFSISGIFAITMYSEKNYNFVVLFLAVMLLFNPILPVYLNKLMWIIIDLVVVFILSQNLRIFKKIKITNEEVGAYFVIILILVPILGSVKEIFYPPCSQMTGYEKAKCEQKEAHDDYRGDFDPIP